MSQHHIDQKRHNPAKESCEVPINCGQVPSGYKSYVQRSSFFKYIFFLFEIPTILKAKKLQREGKALDQTHLPDLGSSERAETMEAAIQQQMQDQRKKNPSKKPSLILAVISVVKLKFLISIFIEICFIFMRIFSCYCCKELIDALSGPDVPNALAFKWAGTLFGVLIGALFLEHHLYFVKYRYPLHLRGALTSLIYSKIGRLSTYSLSKISLGKIVNIVANDLNVFERTCLYFSTLFTGIIGWIAGTALLWIFFGPICLVGIAYIFISLPLQRVISGLSIQPRMRQNRVTDERVRVTSEVIEGIRLLKMYTWELVFRNNVADIRQKEIKELGSVHEYESVSRAISLSTQVVASFLIFMPYSLMGNELEVSKVFPTYFMIGFLRVNAAHFFSIGLTFAVDAKILFKRILQILEEPEIGEANFEPPRDSTNAIEFENFTAYWTGEAPKELKAENERIIQSQDSKPVLNDINLKIKKGSLNALVGKVGSGKSSFALAFTGEMPRMTGSLRFKGSIAYVEQEPTIFAGTIRDNILFGKELNQDFYDKVIEGCNLVSDLKLFSHGDLSEVGEKGVNLSGGQKARIALARAVYLDADIYLLDDPLSAVDAKVAKSLFNNAISTLLKNKTIILITHQVHFVKNLEKIIVIDEGRVIGSGSFEEIRKNYADVDELFHNEKTKSSEEPKDEDKSVKQIMTVGDVEKKEEEKKDDPQQGENKLVSAEDANSGEVTGKTYVSFFHEMGGFFTVLVMLIIFVTNELASLAFGIILSEWAHETFRKAVSIGVMGGITGLVIILHFVKNLMFSHMLLRASHRYHDKMLDRIVRNPVQFFDTNPLGRILSRFSDDIGVLDRFLPNTMHDVVDNAFYIGVLVVMLAYIQPWLLLTIAGGSVGVVLVTKFCYESIKQSRKYELVSKSPVYSLFSASLSGIIIIRSYKQFDSFKQKIGGFIHNNSKAAVAFWSLSRFFGFYSDSVYIITSGINIFILTALSDDIGLTAFGLVLILSLSGILQYFIRQLIQTHILMSSVERLRSYCNTQTEAELTLQQDQTFKKQGWPQKGEIDFNKVYMKYRENMDYVLRDLTLHAEPGEKIGCIGRTGAGKSSIIQTLFRLIEIDKKGQDTKDSAIKIDNLNTRNMGLHLLRDSISIIPQTPFIFSGTVKKNLDPVGLCSDELLWQVLEDVGLKKQVEELDQKLYTDMTNASSVFSVGQKQLICLARTILKKSKVLILDEATANVDKQTDDFIQATIMKKFSDCTIFTIAHRLSTIANYDKVLVLDKGRKVEFDAPYKLLVKNIGDESITNPEGHFASMVLNTGAKTSQQILKVAREKYYSS